VTFVTTPEALSPIFQFSSTMLQGSGWVCFIGDLSWARIKHPRDVLKKGQNVEVVVLDVDAEKKRMSLGYKQLNDPWTGIEERYTKGQDITVKVVRLADFGAFVEVEEGVEGLIHISQLSTKRVDKPEDVLSEGEEVLARVIEINPAERRMRLSISALFEEEIRKNREEEKKKRLAQKAEESRQKQQPTFHEEEPSITIGDVLKDFLNR
jgi:small subunit ribosomal protein S1